MTPFYVGFLPESVEFRCIFNPNKVVQRLQLKSSSQECYAIGYNVTDIDSLYLVLNRESNESKAKHTLIKASANDLLDLKDRLIERNHHTTGLKIQEFYMMSNVFSSKRGNVSNESIEKL